MEDKDFYCYEFGEFRLDARRRSLSKNGEKVPLPARNFDLLLFMVENGGRVLEHEELLEKVWAGTFVEQATLKKGISALRQILAEKPENEFIKTIPRRGYSFVSPVRALPEEKEILLVRETEREITIEEYEETDEENTDFRAPEKIVEIPDAAASKSLLPAETKKTNLPQLAILGGIAAIIALAAFFVLKPFSTKSAQPFFSVENSRVTRITNNGKVLSGAAVSPDGTYLLYPAADKDGVSLWLRQTLANSTKRLTPPVHGGFWSFAIAPDNSYVYYILNNITEPEKGGLYKIPLLGGEPQRIKENVSTISVSPDGKRLALVRITEDTKIFTVNTEGDDERLVTTLPASSRLWGMGWTPDGAALLCTIRKTVEDKMLFYVSEMAAENGKETIVLPPQEKIVFGASWLPDKSALLLTVREANADIRQIWQYFPATQEWRRVTNDSNSYKYVYLTRDGRTIVTTQESRLAAIWLSDDVSLERKPLESKTSLIKPDNFRQITDGISNFDQLGWLSDGRLMYSATEDGKETIFTINADGSNAHQITNGEDGSWIIPSVSGNRQNICFISSRAGAKQVWRVDADGRNATKLTDSNLSIMTARILRDNSTVIYLASKTGSGFLFKQNPNGQTSQLSELDTGFWTISPDEKMIAFETLDEKTRKYHIELRSLEDGKTIKTFDFLPAHQLSFTPDGKNLAYDATRADAGQIMLQPLDGSEPYPLTNFQSDDILSFDWSPGGTRLALIRAKQLNDAVIIKASNR